MHCKGKISREEGFLWGPVVQRKLGSERFWGKCLKQIRVSDKASFKDISAGIKAYINKMSHRKICIREYLYTGKNQQQLMY